TLARRVAELAAPHASPAPRRGAAWKRRRTGWRPVAVLGAASLAAVLGLYFVRGKLAPARGPAATTMARQPNSPRNAAGERGIRSPRLAELHPARPPLVEKAVPGARQIGSPLTPSGHR